MARHGTETHCPRGHPYAGENLYVRPADGRRYCRACRRELAATKKAREGRTTYYSKNKDRAKDNVLRRKYGITLVQYEALSARQNGRCAICGKKPGAAEPRLAVDHDHVTGLLRGLLCRTCNHQYLGRWGDDPDRYLNTASYLLAPPAPDAIGHTFVPDSRGAEGDLT